MTTTVQRLMDLAYSTFTLVYIFGGIVPYIPQYLEIRRLNSIRGFSTYVCLTLLVANILRICFWFVKPFSKPLLIQSGVMITAMLVIMHLAAQVSHEESQRQNLAPFTSRSSPTSSSDQTIWNSPVEHFWHWTNFLSYLSFVALFAVCALAVTYQLAHLPGFVDLLGFAALFTEALLGMPQLIKNYQNQSTKGMSLMMVVMWIIGDVAKSIFFMLEKAPLQFPICGWFQVGLGCFILWQHFYYSTNIHAKTSPF